MSRFDIHEKMSLKDWLLVLSNYQCVVLYIIRGHKGDKLPISNLPFDPLLRPVCPTYHPTSRYQL